jgi:hypothetical protein
MALIKLSKIARIAAAATVAVALSGCGFDGVELNGKIFDAVGLNTGSTQPTVPKLKERAPLVVPPGLEALPEPGSGKAAVAELPVQDHDAIKNLSKNELERQQAEYCDKHYRLAKAHGDESADSIKGPLGPCRGSVLTAIGNINKPAEADEE